MSTHYCNFNSKLCLSLQVWHDNSLQCVQALLAARNATIENWRDHMTFWPILDAYVKLAFQPFLLFQQAELSIHETLREVSATQMAQLFC